MGVFKMWFWVNVKWFGMFLEEEDEGSETSTDEHGMT